MREEDELRIIALQMALDFAKNHYAGVRQDYQIVDNARLFRNFMVEPAPSPPYGYGEVEYSNTPTSPIVSRRQRSVLDNTAIGSGPNTIINAS